MNLLIITNKYPSNDNLYANGFIHMRVKNYIERGHNVEVFVINQNVEGITKYNYDNVKVSLGNNYELTKHLNGEIEIDRILIHFINRNIIKCIYDTDFKYKIIIWIHLFEAIGWYRRLFTLKEVKNIVRYILINIRHILNFRRFIKKSKNKSVKYIFVSNWIKKIAQIDLLTKIEPSYVIHNVIDTEIFKYEKKDINQRKNILIIRPFTSKKYANDLAIDALLYIKKVRPEIFEDLNISIYGEGRYFDELTKPLMNIKNVELNNKFLNHIEIYEQHKKNGIFLCPTRQDSQGVSMCEAMSSGLVVVTSDNTAIPEFVENNSSGVLCNDYKEIANAMIEIYENPQKFERISKNAAISIRSKCSQNIVIEQELEVILS